MHTKKNVALKVRMDDPTLELIERAREYVSLNKSKFIRLSVREKATEIIAQHEKTLFNDNDWRTFFDMLENPQKPTARMKKPTNKYNKIVTSDEV
ncbi:MAG: type II toxin-antitoxin system TacA family antitoxin [Candidatus Anammoxibacter sp.]